MPLPAQIEKSPANLKLQKAGTIFLDEAGTLTPAAQIKLLQVLQDGTFSRVGGTEIMTADVRVITATNDDLKSAADSGRFRKDLYYRLNVFPINIPPLQERSDDIPFLIDLFLRRLNKEMQKRIHSAEPRVIAALKQYEWPGNIRELDNLIERAYILEQSDVLSQESFPSELFQGKNYDSTVVSVSADQPLAVARNIAVEDFERHYLSALLAAHKGPNQPFGQKGRHLFTPIAQAHAKIWAA